MRPVFHLLLAALVALAPAAQANACACADTSANSVPCCCTGASKCACDGCGGAEQERPGARASCVCDHVTPRALVDAGDDAPALGAHAAGSVALPAPAIAAADATFPSSLGAVPPAHFRPLLI
ncbi:MAG: hypothetical protein OER88_01460 [Planctomycetota bacterium]|nr:hypothetical protein [Planctomycetota bacterium]